MEPSLFHDKNPFADDTLIDLLREDNEWALKAIYNRHHLRLFHLAAGVLRDDAAAKDLVQDVFIDLWKRRKESKIQNLAHYLSRAVKFQTLKQLRNGKLREHHLRLMEKIEFTNQTEDNMNFQELESRLRDAMDELPPKCKEVFRLSRFEYLSNKEISLRMKISVKTVEIHMTKALVTLRSRIGGFLVYLFVLSGLLD